MERKQSNFSARKISILILGISFFGCTTVKISSMPVLTKVETGSTLLIINSWQEREYSYSEFLKSQAKDEFFANSIFIEILDNEDIRYELKLLGTDIPNNLESINEQNSKHFKSLGVDFILLNEITNKQDNYTNELNNPSYNVRNVSLLFFLFDVENNRLVWKCVTEGNTSPLVKRTENGEISLNPYSSFHTLKKSYLKSIKKLIQALNKT